LAGLAQAAQKKCLVLGAEMLGWWSFFWALLLASLLELKH
jgi:hypothetical protein